MYIENMEKIVVAVEVGQSKLVAMAASKMPDGKLKLLALESLPTPKDSVCNGLIVKSNDVAAGLGKLLKQLANRLGASMRIVKFYAGLNCRSLATIQVGVPRVLTQSEAITPELLQQMRMEALSQLPADRESQGILSETYALDGDAIANPIGATGGHLFGTFAVACVQPDCANTVARCVELMSNYKLQECLLAPQVVAAAVTTQADREAGCAVVDFGAGCTSVAVYRQGELCHVAVVPLGGKHITADLMSLGLTEKEAESLKPLFGKKYGSEAKKNEKLKFPADADGNERVFEVERILHVCQARFDEIVAYAMQQIRAAAAPDELSAGLIITGGITQMEHIVDIVAESSKMAVRIGAYADHIAVDSNESCAKASAQLVGLLLAADENCVEEQIMEKKKKQPSGKNFFGKVKNRLGDMFSEENMGE